MKKLFLILGLIFVAIISVIALPVATVSMAIVPAMGMGALDDYAKKNFSSFDDNNIEVVDSYPGEEEVYTGFDDEMLDFGSVNASFLEGINPERVFTYTLTNNLATNETVILLPGYNWRPGDTGTDLTRNNASGNVAVDGAIKTVSSASLIGAGSPTGIMDFISFINFKPTQCGLIRIKTDSNHLGQLDQQIIIGEKNPFENSGFKPLNIQNAVLPSNLNQQIALIPTPKLVLCNELQLSVLILAGASVSISFYCGASASMKTYLSRKMKRAQQTIVSANTKTMQLAAGTKLPGKS